VCAAVVLSGSAGVAGQAQPRPGDALVRRVLTGVADVVAREYFDAAVADRVARSLRNSLAEGRYREIDSPAALATRLTADMQALAHDRHLAVAVVAPPGTEAAGAPAITREERGHRENFGVTRVEILEGGVACVRIDAFYRLEEARAALDAAMTLIANADAVIFDLRANAGGAPDSVAYLASYVLDPGPRPLFEIVSRSGEVQQYGASGPWGQGRNLARPVYVLTSHATFSAGEGFAFLLQARHRATVVGERTAGAANPGRPYPVSDGFEVTVPNGHVRVPGTRGNWEGTGVVPDIECAAADAITKTLNMTGGSPKH